MYLVVMSSCIKTLNISDKNICKPNINNLVIIIALYM